MDAATLREAMGRSLSLTRYSQLTPAFNDALIAAQCTTINRAAMFAAQLGHESVGLRYMSEIASGAAYEGRRDLGNTRPGDGPRFKGHGPIQITGRANHTAVSRWAHSKGYVPTPTYFVDHPEQLGDDRYGFLGPVWYWTVARSRINAMCDAGDLVGVTRAINGGTNGLADRRRRWEACRRLGAALLPSAGSPAVGRPLAAPIPTPVRRPRQQEDTDMLIVSPEPAAGQPKIQWPTVRRSMGFDPAGGWGGKVLIKAHFGPRGGWIHLLRWWVRDPNWNANTPRHFAKDHPGAGERDPGVERFIGYGWESAPPAGADELEFEIAAPDGVHLFPFYEK